MVSNNKILFGRRISVKIEFVKDLELKKSGLRLILFLLLFFTLTEGELAMGQKRLELKPTTKLSLRDKKIMKSIHKDFPIDKKTFCNTTPDSNYPYWIGSLKRYQAMDEKWITRDPPGPPVTFIITPSNTIFRDITKALNAIKYVPENDKDALKMAIMIADEDSPYQATVIIDGSEKINGIPKSVLSKYNIAPSMVKNNQTYKINVFSYFSRENKNHFVHAYHTLWKHSITIKGDIYMEAINILWEKRE